MNDADDGDDDDVPDLVENFDEACKNEVPSLSAKETDSKENEDDDSDVPDLIENGEASKEEWIALATQWTLITFVILFDHKIVDNTWIIK